MTGLEHTPSGSDPGTTTDKDTRMVSDAGAQVTSVRSAAGPTPTAPVRDMLTRVAAPPPSGRKHKQSMADAATRVAPRDRTSAQPGSSGAPVGIGSTLKDRFLLEREIGRGGMGVVYLARDLLKQQYHDRHPHVAVKVLGEECKAYPDAIIALQRETGKSHKLAHPNIITVHDFDCDGNVVFMTMEYLDGQTLVQYVKQEQSQPKDVTFKIIDGMAQGLAYAHEKGIVHCDFKPGNVLVTSDGTVKILDFGISRVSAEHQKKTHDATLFDPGTRLNALTPAYASCEMIEREEPDPRDDIYALACVAYELLSGCHPFNRLKSTVARDNNLKPAPIKGLKKHEWKALVHGLAFSRDTRTPSVKEFLNELKGVDRRRTWGTTAVAASLVLMGASGAYLMRDSVPPRVSLHPAEFSALETFEPVALSAEQQDKIKRLLEAADVHFMVGRITHPAGSNSFDAYQHVLEIDPGNKQARAGLSGIADHFEAMARESWEKGDTKQSRMLINEGLRVQLGHPGLIELQKEIDPQPTFSQLAHWFRNLLSR